MNYLTHNILDARCKLMEELRTPSRIEMNVADIKRVMNECDIPVPDDYDPDDGTWVGSIYGIDIYVNKSLENFVITAPLFNPVLAS